MSNSKGLTMFCPACGSPSMSVEAWSIGRAPIMGRVKEDGTSELVVDWENGYLLTPSEDDMPEIHLGCVSCGEPVDPDNERNVVVSSEPSAIMWKKHPGWTPDGWVDGLDTLANYFPFPSEENTNERSE